MRPSTPLTSLILILLLCLQQSTYAAEEETRIQTGNHRTIAANGYAWRQLDTQAKITFLMGITEGLNLLVLQMLNDKRTDKSIQDAIDSALVLTISGFKFSDLVLQVDSFYTDTANLRIPVLEVYRHILQKMKGAEPAELAKHEATLRRLYNQ